MCKYYIKISNSPFFLFCKLIACSYYSWKNTHVLHQNDPKVITLGVSFFHAVQASLSVRFNSGPLLMDIDIAFRTPPPTTPHASSSSHPLGVLEFPLVKLLLALLPAAYLESVDLSSVPASHKDFIRLFGSLH